LAVVDTPTAFRDLVKDLKMLKPGTRVFRDMETTGLDMFGLADRYEVPMGRPGGPDGALLEDEAAAYGPARACGEAIGIPFGKGLKTYYLPYRHEDLVQTKTYQHKLKQKQVPVEYMASISRLMGEQGLNWANHNTKFDLKIAYVDGAIPDDTKVRIDDTMLLAHLLDERMERFTLEYLVEFYTDHAMKFKDSVRQAFKDRKLRRYSQFPVAEMAEYAEDDVRGTWKLFNALYPNLLNPEEPWYAGLPTGEPDPEHKLLNLYRSEMETLWVTTWMEIRGMRIQLDVTTRLRDENFKGFEKELKKLVKLSKDKEFNPFSFKQTKELFEKKGWPVPVDPLRDKETFQDMSLYKLLPAGPKKEPLEHPDHPGLREYISTLVKARTLRKFGETYFDSYLRLADREGFLHPSFNQHGTVTGRLSSSQPNFQNIPKTIATGRTALQKAAEEVTQSPVRSIIVPRSPDHRLVNIDFSQQEIRLFLHYVDEPKMREIVAHQCAVPCRCDHEKYQLPCSKCLNGDVHHYAASEMFNGMPNPLTEADDYKKKRHMAKFINFGIIYGMGRPKLADMFELSYAEADAFYTAYLDAFPHIKETIELVRGVADQRKWVQNAFGRRRRMRLLTAEEKREGKVKTGVGYTTSVRPTDQTADCHKALNAIIQGGAADLVKRSMVRCHSILRGTNSFLVSQIHDELVFEFHTNEMEALLPKVKKAMTDWPEFKVPFTVDVSIAKWEWSTSEASRA